MLEQAIIDAATLREAALKNAEQSIIEKYAPEIKSAVEALLENEPVGGYSPGTPVRHNQRLARVTVESDNGQVGIKYTTGSKTHLVNEGELEEASEDDILQEQEMGMGGGAAAAMPVAGADMNIPPAATAGEQMCPCPEDDGMITFNFSLNDFEDFTPIEAAGEGEMESLEPLGEPTGLEGEEEEEEFGILENQQNELNEDDALQELMDMLNNFESTETLEEELEVDMGATKDGTFQTNRGTLQYEQEMELAQMESDKYKEENEGLEKRLEELDEAKKESQEKTKLYETTIYKLNEKLQFVLLSNAKLLYSNRVLNDASLNERQKTKIVEAINKARSVEEAKVLQETLKTTVGSTKNKGPQSLSESVQRRSNLSSMLTSKRHKPDQTNDFSERMKKLAGIN
tara:strand:+ start:31 stop:1233 length:1203 start_codon:yes stop_codon:yes gene_type:complete